jgi:hypothetical protein
MLAVNCCCVTSTVNLGGRLIEKMGEVAMTFVSVGIDLVSSEDNRTCLVDPKHPNALVARLQSYTPGKENPEFYTDMGYRDWWRFPLVYPYSIHAIDTPETGYLVDERDITDYRSPNMDRDLRNIGIDGITGLTFDKNYLLVKTQTGYQLFDFNSGKSDAYSSEAQIFASAKVVNFTGEYHFMTLEEYNGLFTCTK